MAWHCNADTTELGFSQLVAKYMMTLQKDLERHYDFLTQVYTTEVALLNLANLAASLLWKAGANDAVVDYNELGIQAFVVRHHHSNSSTAVFQQLA
jgi:hypothetical protein